VDGVNRVSTDWKIKDWSVARPATPIAGELFSR